MILVHAFCSRDWQSAVRFFEWCHELDGKQDVQCLLVHSKAAKSEEVNAVVDASQKAFSNVTWINPRFSETTPWMPGAPRGQSSPLGPNLLWRAAVDYISKRIQQAWLWTEPDCVPLKPGWFQAVTADYANHRTPFMGVHFDLPHRHMTGVGVYPYDVLSYWPQALRVDRVSWDLELTPTLLGSKFSETSLIQHVWGDVATNTAPSFLDAESLKTLDPEAVLFHRCKDGTLPARLHERSQPASTPHQEATGTSMLTELKQAVSDLINRWKSAISREDSERPTFVQLGRIGDILNIIPVARFYSTIFNNRPIRILIHKDYTHVVKRCSYILPSQWNGEIWQREQATQQAKRVARKVMVPQLFNEHGGDPASSTTPHYNMEQWKMCGVFDFWNGFPLEIDHREWGIESELRSSVLASDKPLICYNLTGNTGPLPCANKLEAKIKTRMANYELLNLGSFKGVESYTDILGFLDVSAVALTIDTSTLHLAQASHCPYIPIINTAINGWLGSAPRRRPAFSTNYDSVESDMESMLDEVERLAQRKHPNRRIVHCVPRRKTTDERVARAAQCWEMQYKSGLMLPVHIWGARRDAAGVMGDTRDLPFLRDAIESALLQTKDDDILVFTNDDIVFGDEAVRQIQLKLRHVDMITSSRIDVDSFAECQIANGARWKGTRHVGRDLIAWNVGWLRRNIGIIPDFIIGASEWDIVLAAMARKLAGIYSCIENIGMMFPECELPPGLVFHEKHESYWNRKDNYDTAPSQIHNQTLAEEWFRYNTPRMEISWFKRT